QGFAEQQPGPVAVWIVAYRLLEQRDGVSDAALVEHSVGTVEVGFLSRLQLQHFLDKRVEPSLIVRYGCELMKLAVGGALVAEPPVDLNQQSERGLPRPWVGHGAVKLNHAPGQV